MPSPYADNRTSVNYSHLHPKPGPQAPIPSRFVASAVIGAPYCIVRTIVPGAVKSPRSMLSLCMASSFPEMQKVVAITNPFTEDFMKSWSLEIV